MSRSQAMHRVRQALRTHACAHPALQGQISRRDVLRAAGLAAGVALAGGSALRASAAGQTERIAIIGAGIAGLVAALTLTDAGVPCQLFECARRVGGRMHSNRGLWRDGQTSEWCGEFIDSAHVTLRGLAARFGLPLADVNAAGPSGSVDTNYFLGGYYTQAELVADLRAVVPVLAAQNAAIGPTVTFDHHTKAAYAFDHLSVYDWIETYVPGGHASRLGRYLDVAAVTENGLDTRVQSALNLILPLSSDERFHIRGGNERLPQAIGGSLPAGTIQNGWRLTAIATDTAQRSRIALTFATAEGDRTAAFDRVILALPFSVLRTLDLDRAVFDPLKRRAIGELGYGTNAKLVLQFDERYWNGRGPWPGVGDGFLQSDLPLQSAWDSSRAEPGPSGLLTNYTGGHAGAAFEPTAAYTTSLSSRATAAHALKFLAELECVWPGVSSHYQGLAALSSAKDDPNLLGSYSTYRVGQYTGFGGYEQVRQGNVFFAGEHTSSRFQGFMEGGAESGLRAAREVLGTLG